MRADLGAFPKDVRDTCGNVFGNSLRAYHPLMPSTARVLEIGCAEFDWLTHAAKAWPEMAFTGIDWRACKIQGPPSVVRLQGDVLHADFAPESFDWIVSISAIEHVGLGHYQQDPVHEHGDSIAMAHAHRWLKPGGWMYFDVPWNPKPDSYEVVRTSHRVYDDAAALTRLIQQGESWQVRWSAAYDKHGAVVTDPKPLKGGESFYYRAYWLQKG